MSEALPINYKLFLTPDLARFRFSGRVDIRWNAPTPVTTVGLNILELALWICKLQAAGRSRDCPFAVTPADEWVQVTLPEALTGEFVLSLSFEGRINDQMAGFYRSHYGSAEQPKFMAVTQFQESAARRAFPCVDHPAAKAMFEVALEVVAACRPFPTIAWRLNGRWRRAGKRWSSPHTQDVDLSAVFRGRPV